MLSFALKPKTTIATDPLKGPENFSNYLNDKNQVVVNDKKDIRPPSPESLNAQSYFNELQGHGYGNKKSIVDYIHQNKNKNREAIRQLAQVNNMVQKTIFDTNEAIKLRAILEEQKRMENSNQHHEAEFHATKPYKVTALPLVKR